MKQLHKVLIILIVLLCLPSLIVSAESFSPEYPPSIDVSFSEFSNNYDYYKSLSKNYGYIIYIDCTPEETSAMQSLFVDNAAGVDNLVATNNSRSIYVPTTYWNVATQGAREVNGASAKETLYTSKKFYGSTSYEIVIQNLNAETLQFQSHDAAQDIVALVRAGKTAYTTISTDSTAQADSFYLSFNAPCAVYGYIGSA